MEIYDKLYVNWSDKLKGNPDNRYRSKYYRFHRDHGHATESCQILKDEIKYLIRRGHLNKYKKKIIEEQPDKQK